MYLNPSHQMSKNHRTPDLAKKFNISIDFRPFIKLEGITAKEFRKDRINILDYRQSFSHHAMQWMISSGSVRKCVSRCPIL